MNYLYAAYAATWTIHVTYIATLLRRYSKLKREMEELKREPRV
jgi:CcmD family protein